MKDAAAKLTGESLKALDDPLLEDTKWPILGEGAGGVTRKATWANRDVAVKTYVGELTSDGSPLDEKAISVAAASLRDESLIELMGETKHTGSLVMEFLDGFEALAGPPSMQSCSRDVYGGRTLSQSFAWKIAINMLRVLYKLHTEKGICHGDFYGHNILISPKADSVKLSDFGAAFFYDKEAEYGQLLQRVELRSYRVLVEELYAIVREKTTKEENVLWEKLILSCGEATATFEGLLKQFT